MRDCITRTIKTYVTPVKMVADVDGNLEVVGNFEHVSFSVPSENKIRKEYPTENGSTLLIGKTEKKEQLYSMPTEFFVKNAKPVIENEEKEIEK